jgi:hypothetical protein
MAGCSPRCHRMRPTPLIPTPQEKANQMSGFLAVVTSLAAITQRNRGAS